MLYAALLFSSPHNIGHDIGLSLTLPLTVKPVKSAKFFLCVSTIYLISGLP